MLFENKVQRRIFGPKMREKLQSAGEDHNNVHSPLNTIRRIQSRKMYCGGGERVSQIEGEECMQNFNLKIQS
jgi:hypothetical protein